MNPGWRGNYLRYRSYFLNVIARYKERADVKAYVEILLSLVTISIFAIFALRPTLLTIAELIKEIETKQQTIEQMQTKIDNLTKAQNLYDRERSRINILLTSIPDNPNPDIYARQIEGLSGKYGSDISEITAGEAVILGKSIGLKNEGKNDVKALPEESKELNISATYTTTLDHFTSLSNILSDFEKIRRPAKIDSIRLRTTIGENKTKLIELHIEGRLPYLGNTDN